MAAPGRSSAPSITAILALLFSLPVAFGVAFFLVEFCPQVAAPADRHGGGAARRHPLDRLRHVGPVRVRALASPPTSRCRSCMARQPGSLLDKLTQGVPNGYGILAASIILAIMILPFMAATLRELLLTVPAQVRESAYGLGATTFEVVTTVTLPYVRRGAIGAVMLGLGRALGETMAVTFIIGNAHNFPKSLFDAGSTIASTIANEFTEATRPDAYSASLIALGLILFLITFAVLALARLMLRAAGEQPDGRRRRQASPRRRVVNAALRRLLLRRDRASPCWRWPRSCGHPGEERRSAALKLDLFTKATPRRGAKGGLRQRHRRLDHDVRPGHGDRPDHRHPGRHLAGRVRRREPLRQRRCASSTTCCCRRRRS